MFVSLMSLIVLMFYAAVANLGNGLIIMLLSIFVTLMLVYYALVHSSTANMTSDILKLNDELEKNIDFLRVIMDTIPNPIFAKDKNGLYTECNQSFCDFMDKKKSEIIGKDVYQVSQTKELGDVYYKADQELFQAKGTQIYETTVQYPNGKLHDVLFNKSVYLDKNQNLRGMAGVITDITYIKEAERKLEHLMTIKDNLLSLSHSITEITDMDEIFNKILETARNALPITDCASILLIDEEDREKLKIASSTGFADYDSSNLRIVLKDSFVWRYTNGMLNRAIVVNDRIYLKEIDLIETSSGDEIVSIISSPVYVDGELFGFINVDSCTENAYDELDASVLEYLSNQTSIVVKNHKLYEQTVYLSKYDKLTGLYVRSFFESLLDSTIERAERYSETFFIVLYDLNDLKLINDNYGHLAGDKYIKTFVQALKSNVRSSDIIARIGGDEFVGIFHNTTKLNLYEKFSKLNKTLEGEPISYNGEDRACSFSFGISEYGKDGVKYNDLIRIADARMYELKKQMKMNNKK